MQKNHARRIVLTMLFTALGVLFYRYSYWVGMDADAGFSPMHIPVIICGFLCGPLYGAVCGIAAPLLSSLIGAPHLLVAVTMAIELAAYAAVSGFLYPRLRSIRLGFFKPAVFMTLILAIPIGRITYGVAEAIIFNQSFAMRGFLISAFVNSIPGILLQFMAVPAVVLSVDSDRRR